MAVKLKKLREQVVVVTGASSGIGLATAKMAAKRGAKVLLVARNEEGLREAVREIRADGGTAEYVAADVAELDEMKNVVRAAQEQFGGFDTWVNDAGVSIYGVIEEVPVADAKRLFDVNYWGVVHGSLAALPILKERGGALINIGSVTSDQAIPLQGHYSASKHAVKAFTDALRFEVEKEKAPVSITLIKPGSIDTPFPEHARNYMEAEPKLPPPVYHPDVVAKAILACAESPRRDVIVGGGGRMTAFLHNTPKLADVAMKKTQFKGQQMADVPALADRPDALYEGQGANEERGDYPGRVMRSSAYTTAKLHPVATALGVAALGVGVALAARSGLLGMGNGE